MIYANEGQMPLPLQIIIIACVAAFVIIVFIRRIYKIKKGKPVDECCCCQNKVKRLYKQYHKKYK